MRLLIFFCLCLVLLCPYAVNADIITFEEQYTYDAGEADSKLTCRAIALLQAKRLLLEKLGTYLESRTEIVNYQLTREEITSFSAGVVKTEIIDEKWDGKVYSLTAKIEADPDMIAKEIYDLKKSREGREKIETLENINHQSLEKIEELKYELKRIQGDLITINRDYQSASKIVSALDLFETGLQLSREGNFQESINVLTKAIELDPNYRHYFSRGMAYMGLNQYESAVKDFSRAINLTPDMRTAYFHRGRAYMRMGERGKGINDIKRAAQLGSGNAKRWFEMQDLKRQSGHHRNW